MAHEHEVHGRHSLEHNVHRILEHQREAAERLERIETAVGLIQESGGASQGGIERIERKVENMATNQDVLDAVDAIDANIAADLEQEKTEIMAAIAKAAQGPLDTIAAMQQEIDSLKAQIAAGNDVTPILDRLTALRVKADTGIKALIEDAPPIEPTPEPEPPAPPVEGRRR